MRCSGGRCSVRCENQYACYEGVDVSAGNGTLVCNGFDACRNGARCDGGTCGIDCSSSACSGEVCCMAATCFGPSANTCQ